MNWTKKWAEERRRLKAEFMERGITECEIRLPGCWRNNALGLAHHHKRRWYYDKPELLGAFDQVILACNACHDRIEDDRALTDLIFERLRHVSRQTPIPRQEQWQARPVPLQAFDIEGT